MAVWYDLYQTSGGAISRTSEERASEWYHTNTNLIKSYHTVTHVIIFLSYTTTPGIIETASIPITPIYIIQAHTVTFYVLQITVCLSCRTQQAMYNALCDVLCVAKNKIKLYKEISKKKKNKIKIFQKKNQNKMHNKKFRHSFFHKMAVHACIVSHSSYHTRRITLPCYFRWNMTNIGAINITLVYDKI